MTLLTKENILKDNQIFIHEDLWAQIKEKHDYLELRDFFYNLVNDNNISYPFYTYTDIELKDEFFRLKNKNIYEEFFFSSWNNHRLKIDKDLKYQGKNFYIKQVNVGRPCSNAFTQYERLSTINTRSGLSPIQGWSSLEHLRRWDILLSFSRVTKRELSNTIRLSGIGYVSQFSSFTARCIYEISQAKNVLDFSAGWGDRLVGALATSTLLSYTGIDPNTNLHPKYEAISKYYKHKKKTKFICSPAEDAELEPNQFDVIFTSPPYFDLEIYTKEETQSSSRYKNIEDWLNLFLFKVIDKCYLWLEDNGRLFLNISDYMENFFCNHIVDYALSKGFKYEGIIGYNLNVRPTKSELYDEDKFCEPIFVFVKGNPPDLLLNNPNSLF